jgi:hypothetical protein
MLEIALAAVFVTVAVLAISGRGVNTAGPGGQPYLSVLDESSDLPCPWCRAQTHEGDKHCSTCGQRFG